MTFRVLAPNATTVTVGGDINGSLVPDANAAPQPSTPGAQAGRGGGPAAVTMTKGENGIWSGTTVRPVRPGAWRYTFNVDGVTVVDSRNVNVTTEPDTSAEHAVCARRLLGNAGRAARHGRSRRATWRSRSAMPAVRCTSTRRRVTKRARARYPVLYLIHGGGDTAMSWSTVGRANDILDNLLAEKKAVPMIVVMPSGWTPSGGQVMTADATKDPFNDELLKDIIPFVEANYRTMGSADARALSGLSMGGIQTLNIGLHNLGTFRYLAVMSSGWITEQDRDFFYKTEAAKIPKYNSALKLFWWGWGETDIARANGLAVIDKFKSQGVRIETRETPGGHTWDNWRLYLYEVAPKLFR